MKFGRDGCRTERKKALHVSHGVERKQIGFWIARNESLIHTLFDAFIIGRHFSQLFLARWRLFYILFVCMECAAFAKDAIHDR